MPIVRVDLWKGRDYEKKKELIKKLTDAIVESIGCPADAVHIVINDVEKSDWGIGGLPASEKYPD